MQVTGNSISRAGLDESTLSIRFSAEGICLTIYGAGEGLQFSRSFPTEKSQPLDERIAAALLFEAPIEGEEGGVAISTLDFGRVVVEYPTKEAIFLPGSEECEPWRFKSRLVPGDRQVDMVRSVTVEGVSAVMAVPSGVVFAIQTALRREVEWTHPVLSTLYPGKKGKEAVSVFMGDKWMAASVYDNGARYCDILPVAGDPDVIFYVSHLWREYTECKGEVRVSGLDAAGMRKKLSHYDIPAVKTDLDAYH